jgi:hypothetical protein
MRSDRGAEKRLKRTASRGRWKSPLHLKREVEATEKAVRTVVRKAAAKTDAAISIADMMAFPRAKGHAQECPSILMDDGWGNCDLSWSG